MKAFSERAFITQKQVILFKNLKLKILDDNAFMNLTKNSFKNNSALLGGGVIYFKNKLLAESPYETNIFTENTAYFANDFFTFPVRLQVTDNQSFYSWINKSTYSLSVTPAITETSLYFSVVDYYGQTIKSMNGRFFLFIYFIKSILAILLWNLNPFISLMYKIV